MRKRRSSESIITTTNKPLPFISLCCKNQPKHDVYISVSNICLIRSGWNWYGTSVKNYITKNEAYISAHALRDYVLTYRKYTATRTHTGWSRLKRNVQNPVLLYVRHMIYVNRTWDTTWMSSFNLRFLNNNSLNRLSKTPRKPNSAFQFYILI